MNEYYMKRALELAILAKGRTSPNPVVGAVIVRNEKVVGEGWHQKAGEAHAEIHALNQAGDLSAGATIYVTLEPCSHYGRTGSCAEALIKAGIKKVVVAMYDPNPLVAGQGIAKLRAADIEVVEGVMAECAAKMNEVFIKWVTTKMPFCVLKTAMTLDGKIATHTGQSKWITDLASRKYVHELRNQYDAVLTGIGTVLADDPSLTVRLADGGRNPIRIIVDSEARIPLKAKVIFDKESKTIVAVTAKASSEKISALENMGIEVMVVPENVGRVDLRFLFGRLAEKNITAVLIEGGAQINASLLAANVVDKVHWFVAPKIIGGEKAFSPVGGVGAAKMDQAVLLENVEYTNIGDDLLINAYLRNREGRDVYRACGRIG